jgi:spore coat protein U-like protein
MSTSAQDSAGFVAAVAAGLLAGLACAPALAAINCSVSSAGVAFGDYHAALATPDDATGNLTVTCTRNASADPRNVSFVLGLSPGGSGNYLARQMASGFDRLDYNLHTDSARSQIWGDGSASTATVSGGLSYPGSQTSNSVTYPIYGRAPAQQDVKHGNYRDAIVVTVTF